MMVCPPSLWGPSTRAVKVDHRRDPGTVGKGVGILYLLGASNPNPPCNPASPLNSAMQRMKRERSGSLEQEWQREGDGSRFPVVWHRFCYCYFYSP